MQFVSSQFGSLHLRIILSYKQDLHQQSWMPTELCYYSFNKLL